MKRLFLGFALVLLLTPVLFAQHHHGAGHMRMQFGGGVSVPVEPDAITHMYSAGFTVGCGMSHDLAPNLALVGQFDFNSFTLDKDVAMNHVGGGAGMEVDGGTYSVITVSANLKYAVPVNESGIAPYVIGGVGYFGRSRSEMTFSGTTSQTIAKDSESALGLLGGLGIDIPAGETTSAFIEAKYGVGLTENETVQYVPIRCGVQFRF